MSVVAVPRGEVAAPPATDVTPQSHEEFDSLFTDRVSGAQLALSYLDLLGAGLQSLRASIGRHLARHGTRTLGESAKSGESLDAIDSHIQHLSALWQHRLSATAGTLNGALDYSPAGDARQKFTVRGLDFESLFANQATEILNFSIGAGGHRAGSSVTIDPSLPKAAIVHRLDRALAPSGVRAMQGSDGTLGFNVLESQWPSVRDTFTVMGEGRRFSTGRFNRVRIAAEAPVLVTHDWSSSNVEGLRLLREDTFKAQGAVRQAWQLIARSHAEVGTRLEVLGQAGLHAAEATWCAGFIERFAVAAGGAGYLAQASLAPTLTRVDRQRVLTVLTLSNGA